MKNIFSILLLLASPLAFGQNISGIINSYLRVTSVNISTKTFVTDNLSGSISDFQVNKMIMVYQAKGAVITSTNNNTYGTITDFQQAGNYELVYVSSITGTGPYTITVSTLENSYDASGSIQLISVPQFEDVTVTGTVTATPWSSTLGRGGIVALEVLNQITLSADIDVSGLGFAGGSKSDPNGNCSDSATYVTTDAGYATKGEGISTTGNNYGRGARANGGGGGNPHNAGGGGGSNFTYGGNGGQGYTQCDARDAGGKRGRKFDYGSLSSKAFFGGGGGGGQRNNEFGSDGANGGGIILVRANTIASSCGGTFGFKANGNAASNSGGNDGAGAGGAGGTIILDVNNYALTCDIIGQANGGNGGTANTSSPHGGGGGGGIGVIMETIPENDSYVTYQSTPGANGVDCSGCASPSGTLPETPSMYSIGISAIPGTVTTLPVELVAFEAKFDKQAVILTWATQSEFNNNFFTLERSVDGNSFQEFVEVRGAGTANHLINYQAKDLKYFSSGTYYRLKQTDFDGKSEYSEVIYIATGTVNSPQSLFYPNPATQQIKIIYELSQPTTMGIKNSHGHLLIQQHVSYGQEIDISELKEGIYFLEVVSQNTSNTQKMIIKR